ncbi:alpha/beta fold hydrolase [Streptomyces sp. NPDC056169]|uniref:alpha/beta fold hydrolase n=1 Tax=Streptomyces sp. NPDC056169 TaxID=3345734 RepID=UPI0035DCB8EA
MALRDARRGAVPASGRDPVWWSGGLDPARPLVVVVGGALGGGPECARLLGRLVAHGHAVVALHLPRPVPCAECTAASVSRLIDRHVRTTDTRRTRVIGFDLGGRPALAAAATDRRIASVHLVGAPVSRLFEEPDRMLALPPVTVDALVDATGAAGGEQLPYLMGGLALLPEQLYEIRGTVWVGHAPDDPLTAPQDLALLKLTLESSVFHAFGPTGGTSPRGGSVHRWLVDGVRRAGSPAR